CLANAGLRSYSQDLLYICADLSESSPESIQEFHFLSSGQPIGILQPCSPPLTCFCQPSAI
ncbi:hypothetical protein PIB30_114067, partial [Stylosanthes scabra]|nr:hypothetical protein [Stylosanthes scabra]